jgi:hypothetical protein
LKKDKHLVLLIAVQALNSTVLSAFRIWPSQCYLEYSHLIAKKSLRFFVFLFFNKGKLLIVKDFSNTEFIDQHKIEPLLLIFENFLILDIQKKFAI